ncbi:MAG: hypothetical protein ACM3ZE_05675, partial [Myxococcales bacterium]
RRDGLRGHLLHVVAGVDAVLFQPRKGILTEADHRGCALGHESAVPTFASSKKALVAGLV